MGAALIALGVFISSLTDNQGFAAGIGIAVILLNYYGASLSEYVSSTPAGALIAAFDLLGAVRDLSSPAEDHIKALRLPWQKTDEAE